MEKRPATSRRKNHTTMTKLTYSLLSVTLAALCAAQTNNTNSTDKCLPDEFNTFEYVNATTNLTVPGFTPPGFSARNWTINFGLRDERDASGDRSFDQLLMWIDSTVGDEDLFAEDLPYTGCLLEMGMLQYKKSNGGTGEDSCKGVFSDKCYDAILEYAKSSARQEIGVKPNGQCLDMLNFVKDSCDQDSEGWGTTGSSGCKLLSRLAVKFSLRLAHTDMCLQCYSEWETTPALIRVSQKGARCVLNSECKTQLGAMETSLYMKDWSQRQPP